jgi:hypothetical protein
LQLVFFRKGVCVVPVLDLPAELVTVLVPESKNTSSVISKGVLTPAVCVISMFDVCSQNLPSAAVIFPSVTFLFQLRVPGPAAVVFVQVIIPSFLKPFT